MIPPRSLRTAESSLVVLALLTLARAQLPLLGDPLSGSACRQVGYNQDGACASCLGDDALLLVSRADPLRPTIAGRLGEAQLPSWTPRGVESFGTRHALAMGAHGLLLADWDPADSLLETQTLSTGDCRALARSGDTLFAAAGGALEVWLPGDTVQPLFLSYHFTGGQVTALAGGDGRCWAATADSLYAVDYLDPEAPFPLAAVPLAAEALRARRSGELLLLPAGEEGLLAMDLQEPSDPQPLPAWQPGFPVLDILPWRDTKHLAAAAEHGICCVDLAQPEAPELLALWPVSPYSAGLALKGDTLLSAEGEDGLAAYLALEDPDGAPLLQPLGRCSTLPEVLALIPDPFPEFEDRFWLLDARTGFRCIGAGAFHPQGYGEFRQIPLPRPVTGGDLRGSWICGCGTNAGLRIVELLPEGHIVRGLFPYDPVHMLSFGPELLIAYITVNGFVAIKQMTPAPWSMMHHGTINLNCDPRLAAWIADHFLLAAADGRLFNVNVSDPQEPWLVETLEFDRAPTDLQHLDRENRSGPFLLAAGDLLLLELDGAGHLETLQTFEPETGAVVSCTAGQYTAFGAVDPPRLGWFPASLGNPGEGWEDPQWTALPGNPLRLRVGEGAGGLVALENGDLLPCVFSPENRLPRRGEEIRPPAGFALRAWPNPFNPVLRVEFTLPAPGPVRLALYDLLGRRRALLVERRLEAGVARIRWNPVEGSSTEVSQGKKGGGADPGAGIYFLVLECPGGSEVRKLCYLP